MHHHALPPGDLSLLFLASLLGSSHCVGMCGPYVAICSARLGHGGAGTRAVLRSLFLGGRIAMYTAIGAIAGALGQIGEAASVRAGVAGAVSILAGSFALLFALSTGGLLPGPERLIAAVGIDRLARAGAREAFQAPPYAAALLLGVVQGLLPCSMVYAAASRAAASATAFGGALTMLVFGAGTIPAILLLAISGRAAGAFLRLRRFAAAAFGLLGLLLIARGLASWGVFPHTRIW
ncbi:MAG: sulfite exporter TauE/SafE family protein [Thermoanaerobaculia bacterium]